MDLSSIASAATNKGGGKFKFFGKSSLEGDEDNEDNNFQDSLWTQIQEHVFCFYHNMLDVHVYTPLMYAFLTILQLYQTLYFIVSDLKIVDEFNHKTLAYSKDFYKYLPVYPAIIESKVHVAYIFFFLFLFTLMVFYQGMVAFNFLFQTDELQNSLQQSQSFNLVKKQMSNTQKYLLKSASFYFILWKKLLITPSLYFSIDILFCNSEQTNNETASKIHNGSGLECWSSVYIVFVIIGIIHILLIAFSVWSVLQFLNDSFQDSKIPWAQSTLKPMLIQVVISVVYIIWEMASGNKNLKIIPDIICLFASGLTLFFRIFQPSFQSKYVMRALIINESVRFWFSIVKVCHSIFQVEMNILEIIMISVIAVFVCTLTVKVLDARIQAVIIRGMDKIKNSTQLEIYLQAMYKMIDKDEKKTNVLLQGILQNHIHSCIDRECPCYLYKYVDKNESNNENSYKIKQITKAPSHQEKGWKYEKLTPGGRTQKQEMMKAENEFMDQFRLRKATDLEWQRRRKFYLAEDDSASELEAKKTFTPAVWYEFLRYQLKGLVKKLKPTIQSHYTLSGFFFLKLKNEFQSLFELIQAQEKKPDLNQRFLIYRHKKRIEKVIYSKHEKSSQMSRKLNILSVYEYEKNFSKFQNLITKNTYNCIKFWSELLEKDINVVRMHQLGIQISKNHQNITSIANKLLKIYPNQLIMLLNYSKYLNDVVNNEYNASDYFQMAMQQRINLKQKLKLLNNNDNEDLLFGENSFCSIFVLNTEGRKLGIIEYVNEEVQNLLGYSPQELIGKDINTIIPRMIARVHYNLLIKFFEKAESNVLNKVRELFAKDKEGYLIPIYLFSKVLPSLSNGLKLIGVIKKIQYLTFEPECPTDFNKVQQEYVICDAENNIQNFSYGLTVSFGIFPKMFQSANGNSLFDQDVNLEYLSSEFADKAEDLKATGAIITLNTSRLFEKVDREILSNEEFNYFRERAQEAKVFCQMAEMSFSKLVSVKLYRIILFSKLQGDGNKNFDASVSKDSNEDEQLSFNLASASVSSCSSTVMSMDRQLKDFKKQMTDNIEPKIVNYLRRIMHFVLFIIVLFSALIFLFQIKSNETIQTNISNALLESQLLNKFIQTQNNLRTTLNIANNIEYSHKNMTNLPYANYQKITLSTDSRYNYLNMLNGNMIEKIRIITSKVLKKYSDLDVIIYAIDSNGMKYQKKMDFSLALSQYIVNAIELLNRNMTQLKMPAINWTLNSNLTKASQFNSLNAYVGSYYVINTGFRTLQRLIYNHTEQTIIQLEHYDEKNLQIVIILSAVCAIIILSAQIIMIFVVQIVQNNKVRVLSLYSEIRIEDAVDSQVKCKKFYAYLTNSSANFENMTIRDFNNTQQFMSQLFIQGIEEDLNEQWEKFVEKLYYLRVNNQKLNVEKLKRRLNDDLDMRKSIKESSSIKHQYYSNNSDFRETKREDEDNSLQEQQKKKTQFLVPQQRVSDNRQSTGAYRGLSQNYIDQQNQDQEGDKSDNDSTMNKNQITLQNYKRFQQRQSRRFTIFDSQRKMSFSNPQQMSQIPNLKDIKTISSVKIQQQKQSQRQIIIEEEVKENEESNERLSEIQSSKNESDEDSEDHNQKHSRRSKRSKKSLKDLENSKDQDAENRIGKHEQFSQIKSRNWRQILFVITQTLALIAYFIFVMFYMVRNKQEVDGSAKHLWASYERTNEINQLFGFFRERLITGSNYIADIENACKIGFYANENNINALQSNHGSMVNFLYEFIHQTDSVSFCESIAPSNYNLTNCESFQKGLLNQGFKSALFTFINYYTQQNITNVNPDIATSMRVLNSEQVQSFLITSESYMVEITELLDSLWEQSIQNIFTGVKDIIQAVFIIFLVCFFISQVIITPKIINQLNETTWRSRGILNLVPNNIFKEMKQNSRIFKLLKT